MATNTKGKQQATNFKEIERVMGSTYPRPGLFPARGEQAETVKFFSLPTSPAGDDFFLHNVQFQAFSRAGGGEHGARVRGDR